jgi:transaldolase
MNIKVFYDGSSVAEYCNYANVVGVTTNISFLKQAGIRDYKSFAMSTIPLMGGRPISFQVFDPSPEGVERQAREITSWGENVYVKIPVVYPTGESAVPLIKRLSDEKLNINVTCVYTKEQIDEIARAELDYTSIVSVFCGRINDTGVNAIDIMRYANETYSDNPNVETLWAGCQRTRDIIDADECGTDIITVPEGPLKKMVRIGNDIHNFSVRTSVDFFNDGANMFIKE